MCFALVQCLNVFTPVSATDGRTDGQTDGQDHPSRPSGLKRKVFKACSIWLKL